MKRRDFFKKSFYLGSGTAIGSMLSTGLIWKPEKLWAIPPNEDKLVRTRCGSVQTWDYVNTPPTNLYHDAINYPVVEDMLDQAVCSLTENTNLISAW